MWHEIDTVWLCKPFHFVYNFMAVVVGGKLLSIIGGLGKACHRNSSNKTKVMLYKSFISL